MRQLTGQRFAGWITLVSLAWLTGCSQSGDDLLLDYLARLENVLALPSPDAVSFDLPAYPATRALHQKSPDIRLDVFEAWGLRDCAVFKLMAERNAILGKVAEPMVRFDYERRLLLALPECVSSLENDDLQPALQAVLEQKRRAFPLHVWNASLAHPDYQRYWLGGSTPFAAHDNLDAQGYQTAQAALAKGVGDPLAFTQENGLSVLKRISQYPMGGHSLQSMRLAMVRLTQAEALLQQAADNQSLCPQGRHLPTLNYARNVMVKVFVQQVQPWLVSVDQRFLAGFDSLTAMQSVLPAYSQPLIDYTQQLNELHQSYRQQIHQQVQAWQNLFAACNVKAVE